MRRAEPGAVLLEAIVALVILAIVGAAAVATAGDSLRAVRLAWEAARELETASAFLDAVSLWPREDLDRRLGVRRQGPWRLYIERTYPTLYTVVLTDSTGQREILRTALFRPDPDRQVP
jgi:type II secretory pathway pseudopilin PulG